MNESETLRRKAPPIRPLKTHTRVGALSFLGALRFLLSPYAHISDSLTTYASQPVSQGAKGAAVSKGLVEWSCHQMLQNAAIICVKSHSLCDSTLKLAVAATLWFPI